VGGIAATPQIVQRIERLALRVDANVRRVNMRRVSEIATDRRLRPRV
jgi:hypothetical protein